MSKIRIISASAGTGKTHRLAEELHKSICSGKARPEAVLATTFTNKAADELASRIRRRLLQEGRTQEAYRLRAARIGTVNSVCSRLVSDFAFELGLSPSLRVLDENTATAAIKRAMSEVVTAEETASLAELRERIPGENWQEVVERIVSLARMNAISPESLAESADASVTGFLSLLGVPGPDDDALDKELQNSLSAFLTCVTPDGFKKTDNAIRLARSLVTARALPWQDWYHLTSLDPSKKWEGEAEKVRQIARRHDRHPRLRSDCEHLIRTVFDIASRTLDAYQEHKTMWGTVDFVDQEVLTLKLLNDEHVFERLAEELDLLLVDEFQDTSPIQLALFLKLAEAANESIWVGDQKQAIYGFRGTDPALMDAALQAIEKGDSTVDVLGVSWRSRPELVNLTSDLFAPPFEACGISPERVRIKAAPSRRKEPAGLGPVVERWNLSTKKKADDAAAVAVAVRELLKDERIRVWDMVSGEARRPQPRDVAVLCFRNNVCANVATELDKMGIFSELARVGLMSTSEARLVVAGLRLWVDPYDSLAAAEIARILEYPDRGDEWLDVILAKPGIAAFEVLPAIGRVRAAREAYPTAGAVAATDQVIEATQAREMCLRWGDAPIRLGNLDALRVHAVVFDAACAAEGVGCTPAGLIAFFEGLADEQLDERGHGSGDNAVTVSTWHGAKGQEWPITVLFELDGPPAPSALGVRVVSRNTGFKISDPLAGRWLRYWPNPYHPRTSKTEFHTRLDRHEANKQAVEERQRQNLRLLYVIWTRARDKVVVAARTGKINSGVGSLLSDRAGNFLLTEPEDETVIWGGRCLNVMLRECSPSEGILTTRTAGEWYVWPEEKPERTPEVVLASEVLEVGRTGEPIQIGPHAVIAGSPDMDKLGNAVHGFLATDGEDLTSERRKEVAQGLLERWNVASTVSADAILTSADGLRRWADSNWPHAIWHREWPVMMRLEDSSVLKGVSDLVLETADGYIVIDHKSFPGNREQAVQKASSFAGQINTYARAITAATGQPILGRFIHLPLSGLVLPMQACKRQSLD